MSDPVEPEESDRGRGAPTALVVRSDHCRLRKVGKMKKTLSSNSSSLENGNEELRPFWQKRTAESDTHRMGGKHDRKLDRCNAQTALPISAQA
jgi:hypothetical protein